MGVTEVYCNLVERRIVSEGDGWDPGSRKSEGHSPISRLECVLKSYQDSRKQARQH